ncbi:unnamed protein product [Chrysoparadoxa australica]
MQSTQGMLRGITYLSTVTFSATGGVTAAQAGMDIMGCCIVAGVTAFGGGTVRDVLVGRDGQPVVWMQESEYFWLSSITAVLAFILWPYMAPDPFVIDCCDALGVGGACVIGAQFGVRKGLKPAVCIVTGVITATFGGVMRDVLCHRPPRILHSHAEIYASTAMAGSAVYVGLRALKMPPPVKIAGGFGTAVGLRVLAQTLDIKLPTFDRPSLTVKVDN